LWREEREREREQTFGQTTGKYRINKIIHSILDNGEYSDKIFDIAAFFIFFDHTHL
jgi:hypothetical protein